jgi:hypothetical protein
MGSHEILAGHGRAGTVSKFRAIADMPEKCGRLTMPKLAKVELSSTLRILGV